MDIDTARRFRGIEAMISNTPMLCITYSYKGEVRKIYAKAEYYNLSGSIKDRVALFILRDAYEKGLIKQGDTIAEATSGNTGIAFAAMGRYLGHRVVIYMPDWMSTERLNMMRSFGAEVVLVSREEGGFLGSIDKAEKLAQGGGVFLPRQFSNPENVRAHYEDTAPEMLRQLAGVGLVPEAVVAGVGTGGTVMGIGLRFKEVNPNCKAYPLEPANSPTLSTGYKVGRHRIQGISDEFIPDILKLDRMDEVVSVDDTDSIIMARMISERFGVGVGISSGANFLGAVIAQDRLGKDSVVTTVFADDNKKYLSTDYSLEWKKETGIISKDIELLDMYSFR